METCIGSIKRNLGFELLFSPWYEQPEYALSSDFQPMLTEEQKRIQGQYGLSNEQMNWYRQKEEELEGYLRMRHGYPCCIEDCFAFSDDQTYVFDYRPLNVPCRPFLNPIAGSVSF